MKSYSEQIRDINNQAQKEQLWGKPANDIITGIEGNDAIPSERAIWELVQNAHDVANESGTDIEFCRRLDSFSFTHNGVPFLIANLKALNIQTSSKVRNNTIQIGQYGTGFLTTHKFGLKFKLSSSLMYEVTESDGKHLYYHNFTNLLFDRSTNDKGAMIDCLQRQHDEIDNIHCRFEKSTDPCKLTKFEYLQEHEIERDNVKKAFDNAPYIAPYVIALNKVINSISFKDEVEGTSVKYVAGSISCVEKSENWMLQVSDIICATTNRGEPKDKTLKVYKIVSTQLNENNEPLVSVVLPLRVDESREVTSFEFGDNIPKLFLKLPLIGSENWGVNYIFSSPDFTCENESRNSVRFVGNGQNNDAYAQRNREIVALAQSILFDFINKTKLEIKDIRHFAHIDFDVKSKNEQMAEYYKALKNEWISFFQCRRMFATNKGNGLGDVNCGKFISRELVEACSSNDLLLKAIYPILNEMLLNHEHLPKRDDLLFWSDLVSKWFPDEPTSFFFTIDHIAKHLDAISQNRLADKDNLSDILEIDRYILHTYAGLLDELRLIPNEKGIGFSRKVLKSSVGFGEEMRRFLDTFVPDVMHLMADPLFYEDFDFVAFGQQEAKDAISVKASDVISDFSSASRNFQQNNNAETLKKLEDVTLSCDMVAKIMHYLNLFIRERSESFLSKMHRELSAFYNLNVKTKEIIDTNIFDCRQVLRVVINDALAKFTLSKSEDKIIKEDIVKNILSLLFNYKDFSDLLRYYPVYKNQTGKYRYYNTVKYEEEIPETLKKFHDLICGKFKGTEDTVRDILTDNEYRDYLIDGKSLKGSEVAEVINEKLLLAPYPKIAASPYRAIFIEILTKHCEDPADGYLWSSWFTQIYNDKAHLLLDIIESPSKKECLTHLMTIEDDEKLSAIVKLAESSDFEEIIRLGKEALSSKIRNDNDTKYKKMLGSFVEDWIQSQLDAELGNNVVKCDSTIDNEQGGQDLIIYLNGEAIYYIEIKSRWNQRDSLLMSKLQMKVSSEKKDRYALCAVDMTGFDQEKAERHEYPEINYESLKRIKVANCIGFANEKLEEGLILDEDMVHLGGDFKSVVPQSYLNVNSISFERLINNILNLIKERIDK